MPDPSKHQISGFKYRGKSTEERFWEKVVKLDCIISPNVKTPCWLWTGATNWFGYGNITMRNRHCIAHRLSWIIHKGDIPDNLSVLHKCDIPNCIRVSHLFLGTYKDNLDDARKKGRWIANCGESIGTSKLTSQQVEEIRHKYQDTGITQKALGKFYAVTEANIKHIIDGRAWKKAPGPVGFKKDNRVRGERHQDAKLTEKSVRKIWELHKAGVMGKDMAPMLKVHRSTIYGVLSGKYWKHVLH